MLNIKKNLINKLLYPHWLILIFAFLFVIMSMSYIVLLDNYNTWVSYIIYPACFYFFVIICLKVSKVGKNKIDNFINNSNFLRSLRYDPIANTLFTLYKGLVLNIVYALFNLIIGIVCQSFWFVTFGVYYLLLSIIRFSLVLYFSKNTLGNDYKKEIKRYKTCGILLLFLNIILTGMIVLVILKNETINYPGYFIYVVALYTFYIVIMGIINVAKYRKYKSPIMSAVRVINLSQALISMLSLEIAMLHEFGNKSDVVFNRIMIGATGEILSLIFITISTYMIIKSNKKLNNK